LVFVLFIIIFDFIIFLYIFHSAGQKRSVLPERTDPTLFAGNVILNLHISLIFDTVIGFIIKYILHVNYFFPTILTLLTKLPES